MRKPKPKSAPRVAKLEKFPIETLKESDGFVLVYSDSDIPVTWENGKAPYCLARRNGNLIQPMYTSGDYAGAKWWRPVPLL